MLTATNRRTICEASQYFVKNFCIMPSKPLYSKMPTLDFFRVGKKSVHLSSTFPV